MEYQLISNNNIEKIKELCKINNIDYVHFLESVKQLVTELWDKIKDFFNDFINKLKNNLNLKELVKKIEIINELNKNRRKQLIEMRKFSEFREQQKAIAYTNHSFKTSYLRHQPRQRKMIRGRLK